MIADARANGGGVGVRGTPVPKGAGRMRKKTRTKIAKSCSSVARLVCLSFKRRQAFFGKTRTAA